MRVLLDTNVLLAAFIAKGSCREVFEHVARQHELISSEHILEEFSGAMVRKFKFSASDAADAVALIRAKAVLVEPAEVPPRACRDADDLAVLGAAIAGECDCIVTGDLDLLVLKRFRQVAILKPAEFWKFEHERGQE